MSWTDEEIDQLVSEAAASQKVVYNDTYWDEMNGMLNSSSTKKGMFWWTGMAVVLILTSAGLAVYGSNVLSLNTVENQLAKKEITNKKIAQDNQSFNLIHATRTDKKINRNNQSGTIQTNSKKLKINELGNSNNANNSGFENGRVIDSKLIAKEKLAKIVDEKLNYSDEISSLESKSTIENELIESKKQNVSDKYEINKSSTLLVRKSTLNINDVSYERLSIDKLQTRSWEETTSYNLDLKTGDLPIFLRSRLGFYADVRAGIGQSYVKTERNNELYQIGFGFGLEYFKQNWIFSGGIALRQQFAKNLEFEKNYNQYSFGTVRTNQQLNYDQLIFVDLPFSLAYQFNKSAFGIQIAPTYLLGSRLSYSINSEETVGDKVTTRVDNSPSKTFVSSNNFSTLGCNLGISYSYSIINNLSINAYLSSRVNGNLLRTKFENTTNQVPVMFELGIRKRF